MRVSQLSSCQAAPKFVYKDWGCGCIPVLHAAASQGQHEVVQLLLDLGLSLGLRDSMGLGPLSHACQAGHAHTVQILLDAGAKVRDADNGGRSPLHWWVWLSGAELAQQEEGMTIRFINERKM